MTTLSVELERLGDQKRLCSIKTERGGGGEGGVQRGVESFS